LGLCASLVLGVGCLMFPAVSLADKCLFCEYCHLCCQCHRRDRD